MGTETDGVVHVGRLSQLRPRVNFANYLATEPGQSWGPRVIPDSQLVLLLSGRAALHLGGKVYELQAGDGVFYGSDSPHLLVSSSADPMTFSSIHFSWDADHLYPVHPGPQIRFTELHGPAVNYLIDLDRYGLVSFPHVYHCSGLDTLFLRIVREYRSEEIVYPVVLSSLLIQLLAVILRHHLVPDMKPDSLKKVLPAIQAIRNQPGGKWTVAALAELCGYQPNYFCEVFKSSTGHSPKSYIMLERVRIAKTLLTERRTIDQVATELGYSSTHYFCRHFKRMTGLTPASYRRQNQEL